MSVRIQVAIDVQGFSDLESIQEYARTFLGLDRPADNIDILMAVFDGEVSYTPVEDSEK